MEDNKTRNKYVSGPWQAVPIKGNVFNTHYIFDKHMGAYIATIHCPIAPVPLTEDEANANAQLVAAAPELLEALKQVVWKVDQTQGYKTMRKDAVMDIARQAIAKAKGK